jgi:hypothetical protein
MLMRRLAVVLGLAVAAIAGGAFAQQAQPQIPAPQIPASQIPAPQINVSIGPALQARAHDFGARELEYLSKDLRETVAHALAHARFVPVRVDLVIEDATPNRPTFEQLSRSTGLSMWSIGLGGARISGTVVGPDGTARPLRYQYFETDLREDRGAVTWTDADRSFSFLADDLAHGHISDRYQGPGPQPNGGHFGYPYTGD